MSGAPNVGTGVDQNSGRLTERWYLLPYRTGGSDGRTQETRTAPGKATVGTAPAAGGRRVRRLRRCGARGVRGGRRGTTAGRGGPALPGRGPRARTPRRPGRGRGARGVGGAQDLPTTGQPDLREAP